MLFRSPAQRIYFGEDSLAMLGRELEREACTRAVIVCGASLVRHPEAFASVRDALGSRFAGAFTKVQAHSPLPVVQEAARELLRLRADAVIAVGGGSAIVTARAASILAAEGTAQGIVEAADARQLCTRRGPDGRMASPKLNAPKHPQFVVLTTPTTACVKAGSAVFDPAASVRLAMYDPKTRARAVFLHPRLLATAPPQLVLSASMNTLIMAVEGLESSFGNPMSEGLLMQALRLLSRQLPLGIADDATARGELALAAILCGQGTEFGGGGLASALGHAIGARHEVENGIASAILLPHTMRFNADATEDRAASIAIALGCREIGGSRAIQAAAVVEELLSRLSLPRRLRDVGLPREALTAIAEHAMDDWFLQKNPRPVRGVAELGELLHLAW